MISVPLPVRIAGLGSHLPPQVETNDDLAAVLDTSDEWIRTRTGIGQRHLVAPGEATSDLALAAAKAAVADAGIGIEDLGAVVVATTTPDHPVPATAPLVAAALGTRVPAFDLNGACSGFVYGLMTAGSLVATSGDPVLLVGADALSRLVDPHDRTTRILFGDGAGAAVLAPDPAGSLGPFDAGADGSDPSMLWCPAGGTRQPVTADAAADRYIQMRGGDVYRYAVAGMVASTRTVLDRAGIGVDDVDLLVGHQANARILDAVVQRLGIDPSRSHLTIDRHANTSAASVPLALDDARDRGRLTPGATVLLTAFGAGLTWGSCLLRWDDTGASRSSAEVEDDDATRDLTLRAPEEDA